MSLAKAAFSGKVYREPQMRSTSSNIPITYFTFNIGTEEEELIRVRAVGNLAEKVEKEVVKNDSLVVEGNLTLQTIKTDTGAEKRIVELLLLSYEKIAGSGSGAAAAVSSVSDSGNDDIVKFKEAPEDLIGEDEVPF